MAAVIQQTHQVVKLAVLVPGLVVQVPVVQVPVAHLAGAQVAQVLAVLVLTAHQLVVHLAMESVAHAAMMLDQLATVNVAQTHVHPETVIAALPPVVQLAMVIAALPPVVQLAMVIAALPPVVQLAMVIVAHAAMTRDLQTDHVVMTRVVQRDHVVTMIADHAVIVTAMTEHLVRVAQIAMHRRFQITLRAMKSIVQFETNFAVCQTA